MTDPLFGSVSPPLWPAIPATVDGHARPAPNTPDDPHAFGGVFGGPSFGNGLSAVVSRPLAGGVPFMGAESAIGVTAPALLAAVAMRRGQPLGPTNDQEVEDLIYDAFDLLPGTNEVDVRVEGGGRCCPARSRTNGSSATSVNWPGRFPR